MTLSHSVKELLPLKNLHKEVIQNLGIYSENMKFVSRSNVCKVNNGAIVVATITSMTPTSKHISSKYHWFMNHIGKDFGIQKIKLEN